MRSNAGRTGIPVRTMRSLATPCVSRAPKLGSARAASGAKRIDAAFGPHRMRRVIGDDARDGNVEQTFATRASEHDEGNMMRRDDRTRRECCDLAKKLERERDRT